MTDLRDRVAEALDKRLDGSVWTVDDLADVALGSLGLDDFEAAVERLEEAYVHHPGDPFDAREDFRVGLRAALKSETAE